MVVGVQRWLQSGRHRGLPLPTMIRFVDGVYPRPANSQEDSSGIKLALARFNGG